MNTLVQQSASGSSSFLVTICDSISLSWYPPWTSYENTASLFSSKSRRLIAKPAISSGNGRSGFQAALKPITLFVTLSHIGFSTIKPPTRPTGHTPTLCIFSICGGQNKLYNDFATGRLTLTFLPRGTIWSNRCCRRRRKTRRLCRSVWDSLEASVTRRFVARRRAASSSSGRFGRACN